MFDHGDVDYNTLSREELVKVATNLRDERDKYRDENDMLRRSIKINMQRFCEDIVPDFTPLGGNRPDCAVASGASVSLSDVTFNNSTVKAGAENPLPPDVFACAVGILCAPVIISASLQSEAARRLCERRGPARTLSVRLCFKSEEDMYSGCGSYPWNDKENDYRSVFVKMDLPSKVVILPDYYLYEAPMVKSIDLRSTSLTTLGNSCTRSHLSQAHLPSTVTSIGDEFLIHADVTSIDLRHTGLTSLGKRFMDSCRSIKEVHLPPSVTRISDRFLYKCPSLVCMDLRHFTGLTSLGEQCMAGCDSLTELLLPPSVTQIKKNFLGICQAIKSIDLRHLTGLTSVDEYFMVECGSLTDLHLPPSITAIERDFLLDGSNVTSIDLRHLTGLTSLRGNFMYSCDSLMEIHLPPSVTQIEAHFIGACRAMTSIDLRHLTGLTFLDGGFMTNCKSLKEVHLPPSITQINGSFLFSCRNITSIDLRHVTGLTSLGRGFMADCDSLKVVTLPDSVTQLPEGFLEDCPLNPVCHWVGSRRGEKRER